MINFLSTENLFTPVKQNIQLEKWKENILTHFPWTVRPQGDWKLSVETSELFYMSME
jgi:hypothetical protein